MIQRLLAALAASVLLLAGCGGDGASDASAQEGRPPAIRLPSQVLGLEVVPEEIVDDLETIERPYVDTVAMFSFREDDLLRATLQLARFNNLARPEDSRFRGSIVGTIGGTRPVTVKVGDQTVTMTGGTEQSIFIWFSGDGMFVLSVAQDYEFPRTLLRRLIESDLRL